MRRPPEPLADLERSAIRVLYQHGWKKTAIATAMRRSRNVVLQTVGKEPAPTKDWAVAAYLNGTPARAIGLGGGSLYNALRKAGHQPNRGRTHGCI